MLYVVGLLSVMFGSRHQRFGDLAAGTLLARGTRALPRETGVSASKRHSRSTGWFEVRRRAAALGRRRRSEVSDALAVVDDYRHAARELGAARLTPGGGAGAAPSSRSHLRRSARRVHRAPRRAWMVLWSVLRDRVPAAMRAMRVHVLGSDAVVRHVGVVGWWLVYTYPDLIADVCERRADRHGGAR